LVFSDIAFLTYLSNVSKAFKVLMHNYQNQ